MSMLTDNEGLVLMLSGNTSQLSHVVVLMNNNFLKWQQVHVSTIKCPDYGKIKS